MSAFRRLWAWPIALGVVTAIALVVALLTDGAGRDVLWSLALPLGAPVWRIARGMNVAATPLRGRAAQTLRSASVDDDHCGKPCSSNGIGDPDGHVRAPSKGIEIDAAGRIGRNVDVVASYAYTDVRYTRSDTLQGERLSDVPRHGASLWGSYRFAGSGWRAGAGVVYRSSMLGTQRAWEPDLYPYTLDGYTLVNAMIGYDFRLADVDAQLQLNVHNLTDERYHPTTYGGTERIGLGEPRSVLVSLRLGL